MENKEMKTPESVPYIVYESEMARSERHIKRLYNALIVAVICIVVCVLTFVWYINQYDFVSYEQDGQGINIIGDGNGVDYNGPANESEDEAQSLNLEG